MSPNNHLEHTAIAPLAETYNSPVLLGLLSIPETTDTTMHAKQWYLIKVRIGKEVDVCQRLNALRAEPPLRSCIDMAIVAFPKRQAGMTKGPQSGPLFPGCVIMIGEFTEAVENGVLEIPGVVGFCDVLEVGSSTVFPSQHNAAPHRTKHPLALPLKDIQRLLANAEFEPRLTDTLR